MLTCRIPFLLCVLCFTLTASAALFAQSQPPPTREIIPLNDWKFDARVPSSAKAEQAGFGDAKWQSVTVPHTWTSKTQTPTYRSAWYRTHFQLAPGAAGQKVFACFDGVGTIADVFVNGVHIGAHRGAYTRFVFDATAAAHAGDNVLAVCCDTAPLDTADCLPAGNLTQLYHVPGGIYRPAHLLLTAAVHVDPTDLAASGLFLTPAAVSQKSADLEMKTLVRNDGPAAADVAVISHVFDRDGKEIAAPTGQATLASHSSGSVVLHTQIEKPHLWSTTDPYLYSVRTETAVGGIVTDSVTERTGLRFFRMTPEGFFLNGVLTPLRGVAKHQETEEHGNAVSEADLRRDWADLKELGVNFVRLAHYPHAQLEYDLADEMGIVVWAENGHSNKALATDTGRFITREMVWQNCNHPSICFWSIGNEAIRNQVGLDKIDISTLEDYARTARAADPTRLITYASDTTFHQSPYLDFVAINRYNGWYGGSLASFNRQARAYHYISETGAGGVISTHTSAAVPPHRTDKFEPEEAQDECAESRCETTFRTLSAQIPMFTWWTFRDFSDPRYKGVNAKGLETYGAFHKDAYSLFQSFLKPQTSLVHLCGKTWFLRRRTRPSDTLNVKAYSNAAALTLTINGTAIGTEQNGDYVLPDGTPSTNVFVWPAVLSPGRNAVTVSDGLGHTDSDIIYAETGETEGLVRNLQSSNPANPANFIPGPVEAEWPFYDNFDGTGDNTFHAIPAILQGAGWITMKRPTVPASRTTLRFTLAPDAGPTDIFLLMTEMPAQSGRIPDGYTDTGVTGTWRGNSTNLTPFKVYQRTVSSGQTVFVPSFPQDYLVLLKPHAVVSGVEP
jgi:beta-galactosidase